MNKEQFKLIDAETCYMIAEQRAANYFQTLNELVTQKTYVSTLIKDFQAWKLNHIHHHSILSFFSRSKGRPDTKNYSTYIQWLDYTWKLEPYLDRSISYLYMRDLGKALDTQETQARIRKVVGNIKNYLTSHSDTKNKEHQSEMFSMSGLYRWAEKEGIQSTFIWLMDKLKIVSNNIPKEMDAVNAQRKLMKIIAGVIMHVTEEMGEGATPSVRTRKLDEAIRLGYAYGLTYPFIDDLLDANILADNEQRRYSDLIRTALITGNVPELGEWSGENKDFIQFVHVELRDAFEYIKKHHRPDSLKSFFEQAYVFFQSQEVDRSKELTNAHYTNEELYIPIILKSSSSRLIARSVLSASQDDGFEYRTFYYGIYNQLADDFADLFDDLQEGAVTPYTYYLTYHNQREDLINPFELYWAVISHLIHHIYRSDRKSCEVILDRAINGLKRYKERMGIKKYNEVMNLFFSGVPTFNAVIQKMVQKADDVDFFDKLLRDQMLTTLKNEQQEQEQFLDTVKSVRNQINQLLHIPQSEETNLLNEPIIEAANYSLEGDGKRLRSIITWVMGVKEYQLNQAAILPLLRSLEYMHTASLIFDDLPSQDNASMRRGRNTLHIEYNMAVAELTGLFLTQKAIAEQASLTEFDSKTVLKLIQYSTHVTEEMCKGQAMDLASKGKRLTQEQLNAMSFYKTGLAFEASLIMPAILAQVSVSELNSLKKFAYHAGIAFQIKDDLLDVEGEEKKLGKLTGKDVDNNNSTFVSILGLDGAKKVMWDHYCLALESLLEVPRNTTFLKHLMNYIVNRDH
ncbi:polyprenyl synthetase family protein [Bacillus sp. T3]|uniref:polyprenyl synthetase family protein n=1 Tax=Bacillus sp. T3 TaxID=467262 RepID=UPI002982B085|nr:polyprenyl synthetase family protein [Bacillus sp. T3]